MAWPFASAASIESLSFILPPGCEMATMPASCAIVTQSGKGKNASLAITAPCKSNPNSFAFLIAPCSASTRDVWPQPIPISWLFLTKAMPFDLRCLTATMAKVRSAICCSVGALVVATLNSFLPSAFKSASCSSTDPGGTSPVGSRTTCRILRSRGGGSLLALVPRVMRRKPPPHFLQSSAPLLALRRKVAATVAS